MTTNASTEQALRAEIARLRIFLDPSPGPSGGEALSAPATSDATDPARLAEEFAASVYFLQRVAVVAPGVLHVFDVREQRSVFSHGSVAAMLGYGPEEISGLGEAVICTLMHPDDKPRFAEHMARARALGDGDVLEFEYRMRGRSDAWHWFANRDAVFGRGSDGAVRLLIGTATEIAEPMRLRAALNATEAFIRQVLEASPDWLMVLDEEGRLKHVNANGCTLMEIDDLPSVLGRSWASLWPAGTQARIAEAVAAATAGVSSRFEAFYPTMKGTPKWWDVAVHPAPDPQEGSPSIIVSSRDLTERKQLDLARLRLAAIVESSDDAILSKDLSGTIITWNTGAQRLFGYTELEVVGQPITILIPPDRLEEEARILARLRRGERFDRFETVRVRKGGALLDVAISIYPIVGPDGRIVGASTIVRDLSERKETAAALREVDRRFRGTFENAAVGIAHVGADGRWLNFNDRICAITGYAREELLATTFQRITHPDDLAADLSHLDRVLRGDADAYAMEKRYLRKDGSSVWVNLTVSCARAADGTVEYFIAVVEDISERKRTADALQASDERTRLATTASGVGIWEWNVVTAEIRWDAEMFRIYGIPPTPDGIVSYQTWSAAVLPEDVAAQEAVLQETVRRGGQSRREFRIRRAGDGAVRVIQAVETCRVNAAGKTEWVVGTNLDVTERRDAEVELRRLAAELSEADRRKDAFLATLAHELRNPLAPLRTDLHLLRIAGIEKTLVETAIARMDRQLAQVTRLIDDLMDVSRITQDKLTLRLERLQLASVVYSAVESSRPFIESRGHTLTVTVPRHAIEVDADPVRLAQVFANLLTNAAKYSDQGGHIGLTVEPREQDVLVTVRDQGIGIVAEAMPRLFQMFAQLDPGNDRTQGGLGIGLHLVKRLVEMHGGAVEARSEGSGCGSEFVVRLPLALSLHPIAPATPDEAPSALPSILRRVLVADDNEDAVVTLALMLTHYGHDVRTASDGQEAVALAAAFRPHVILLDIGMPKLNGYEACRRIRAQAGSETMILVALTGWGQTEDKRRALEAGFDHHLVKPVDPTALDRLLRSVTTATD